MNTAIIAARCCLSIGLIGSLWAFGLGAPSSSRIAVCTLQSFDAVHQRCLQEVESVAIGVMTQAVAAWPAGAHVSVQRRNGTWATIGRGGTSSRTCASLSDVFSITALDARPLCGVPLRVVACGPGGKVLGTAPLRLHC
jgi:hypothetical protein